MEQKTRIDIPIVLPQVDDLRDACVERLVEMLQDRPGVTSVHIVDREAAAQLCLHYDPELLTLAQVEAIAKAAGAEISDRFAHVILPFHAVGSEDAARRLEDALRAERGVTAASVNLAGQVARVEFDRRATDETKIRSALSEAGARVTPADEAPGSVGPPEERGWYARNRELAWSLTSGALLAVAWILSRTSAPPLVPIAL